jgi:hypothetical protein
MSAWGGTFASPTTLLPYLVAASTVGRNAMRLKDARNALRQHDMVLERGGDEYSVNFAGGEAETAYYTNDLEDAVNTGLLMRRWKTATDWPTLQSLA